MQQLDSRQIAEGALLFLQRVNLQGAEAHSFVAVVEGLKAMLQLELPDDLKRATATQAD